MSYMDLNNARIRENGKKRNLFDKVNEIKQFIKTIFPEIDGDRLMAIMAHCRAYYEKKLYYGRRSSPTRIRRELTLNERIIYDWMLKNNLRPGTVYRWFLASKLLPFILEFSQRFVIILFYKLNARHALELPVASQESQTISSCKAVAHNISVGKVLPSMKQPEFSGFLNRLYVHIDGESSIFI